MSPCVTEEGYVTIVADKKASWETTILKFVVKFAGLALGEAFIVKVTKVVPLVAGAMTETFMFFIAPAAIVNGKVSLKLVFV